MLPLAGIRGLDLAMMAGPCGATMLGDVGADVIKIEPPGGDEARRIGPAIGDDSRLFVGLIRYTRGLPGRAVLDLVRAKVKEQTGREGRLPERRSG